MRKRRKRKERDGDQQLKSKFGMLRKIDRLRTDVFNNFNSLVLKSFINKNTCGIERQNEFHYSESIT